MTSLIFLLFLGLIVFGPNKTTELAQEVGRMPAQVKHALGKLSVDDAGALTSEAKNCPGKNRPGFESRHLGPTNL
jgi:Sec-independent protein translocase protein TatA